MNKLSKELFLYTTTYLKEKDIINILIINKFFYKNYRMIRKNILIQLLIHKAYVEGIRDGYCLYERPNSSLNGYNYNDIINKRDTLYVGRTNVLEITKVLLKIIP